MKTKIIALFSISIKIASGQISNLTNGPITLATDFVGWMPTVLQPLNIEHQDGTLFPPANTSTWPIVFKTAATERLRIGNLQNGLPLQPQAGYLANTIPGSQLTRVRINYGGGPVNPAFPGEAAALLHLGIDWFGSAPTGTRDWQNIGTLTMGGSQHLYVGLREKDCIIDPTGRTSMCDANANREKDAVINWGDSYTPNHPFNNSQTNLCFIFTSHLSQWLPDLGSTNYGKELMRMNGQGRIGIGPAFHDWLEPQNMLHLNNVSTDSTFIQVTRSNLGQAFAHGLLVGLNGAGTGVISQQYNRDLTFFTNSTYRAVMTAGGDIGFNPVNPPNNKVEITSSASNPYGLTGSGLRFTNLTSANNMIPNGTNGVISSKVLTVDQNGDVVLTGPMSSLGNYCSNTTNPLIADYEIPLNTYEFHFSGDGNQTDKVYVGLPCGNSGMAKFNVNTAFPTLGSAAYGIAGIVTSNVTGLNCGVYGQATGVVGSNYGGTFLAQNGTFINIGVEG
jgi:hypothetical protein